MGCQVYEAEEILVVIDAMISQWYVGSGGGGGGGGGGWQTNVFLVSH